MASAIWLVMIRKVAEVVSDKRFTRGTVWPYLANCLHSWATGAWLGRVTVSAARAPAATSDFVGLRHGGSVRPPGPFG